jgi:hypothetical protein
MSIVIVKFKLFICYIIDNLTILHVNYPTNIIHGTTNIITPYILFYYKKKNKKTIQMFFGNFANEGDNPVSNPNIYLM